MHSNIKNILVKHKNRYNGDPTSNIPRRPWRSSASLSSTSDLMAHIYSISQLLELAHSPLVVTPDAVAQIDMSLFQTAPRANHHQKDHHKDHHKEHKHRNKERQWKKPQWDDVTGMEFQAQHQPGPSPAPTSETIVPRKPIDLWEGDISYQTKKDGASRFSSLFGSTPQASPAQQAQPLPAQQTQPAQPSPQARSPLDMDSLKGYLPQRMYGHASGTPGVHNAGAPGLSSPSLARGPQVPPPGMGSSPPGFMPHTQTPNQKAQPVQSDLAFFNSLLTRGDGSPSPQAQGPARPQPQGLSQGHHGLSQGIPQGFNQGLPSALHQGLHQGLNHGLPQGLPQGLSQGIPKGVSQGVPQGPLQGQPSTPTPAQPSHTTPAHPYAFYGMKPQQLYGSYAPPPGTWPDKQQHRRQ